MKNKRIMIFKISHSILSLVILSLLSNVAIASENFLNLYHQANIAYQKQDYETSIRLYDSLVRNGQLAPEIYFNLGNAYYKSGNTSKSILNFERALKLEPGDEDILFNLKVASLRVVDKIDAVPEIFYKRWFHSLTTLLPADTWSTIFLVLVWLVAAGALVYVLSRSGVMKKISFLFAAFALFFTLAAWLIANESHKVNHEEKGIIVSPSIYVKSSPDEKGNDLFIIHEGTKVEVLDHFTEWSKIRIANGSIGWMKQNEMEVI